MIPEMRVVYILKFGWKIDTNEHINQLEIWIRDIRTFIQ
jgi:hypothetical protein